MKRLWVLWLAGLFLGQVAHAASALYRDGVGARPMALGGADVALAEGPLSAYSANPAGAAAISVPTLDLGAFGGIPDAQFNDRVNRNVSIDNDFGAIPEGAFGIKLGKLPLGITIGSFAESAASANWQYFDAPGGADGRTTYGFQTHKSEFLVLRSGAGIGWAVTPHVSLGAGVGLIYNENTLNAPYIFQTQPALKGAKTLLDLHTSGYGCDGQVGALIHPNKDLQFGLAYKSPATVHGTGDATGNVGVQFANLGLVGAPAIFHYDAEVDTTLPQSVTGGIYWLAHPCWGLVGQVDWINWQNAFDTLPVKLSNGNNPALNGLTGSPNIEDDTPLQWKDQTVYHAGLEYYVTTNLTLRAGYSYGNNPVPARTLTPLTAIIPEHTLTTGIGYAFSRMRIDLAYQYSLPRTVDVGNSGLLSGEYSNSSTKVSLHWLGLTLSTWF